MRKTLEQSLYHSFLRIMVSVFAIALVFDSGLLFKETILLSNTTEQYLASVVGVTVGVAPTELNQLTSRITELETELEAKERLIAVSVGNTDTTPPIDTSTFILSIILFILLTLIVLNYVLDFVRARRENLKQIYAQRNESAA